MKFAQVRYGVKEKDTGEKTKGYTYLVNDSVKKGSVLQPSVVHYKSGKIFATTGVVLETHKNLSTASAKPISQNLKENNLTEEDIAKVTTTKEAGISQSRTSKGTYSSNKGTHDEKGRYITTTQELGTRGANILERQQETGKQIASTEKSQKAVETFETYSKKFMGN